LRAVNEDLCEQERALQEANDCLELRVRERTAELEQANRALREEIAERKRAEEAVSIERQRLKDVLEMLPAYVVLLTPDHHVPFANRFFRERFGESHGRRCFEYLFGRTEPCEPCDTYKVLQTNSPHNWQWTGPDGRDVTVGERTYQQAFYYSAQDRFVRIYAVDITERRQMEAELRRLNDQLEQQVLARTEELRASVDRLEDEVARRVLAEDEQQKAYHELDHRTRQLQHLTLELSQAEDRERKRLAEILHDDLQQILAAAKFHLGILSSRLKGQESLQEMAGQLNEMLREAIEKSRSLSHELSPAVLYQSDLGETFEWLARRLKAKHGLTVHVESRGRIDSASEPLKVFLFRTAQEILFNVVKHARVHEARLRLQRMHGGIWLTISDQGQGFDPRSLGRAEGFGLLSIRERIELLGGRMKIRSTPGRGSTFLLTVPDGPQPEDGRQTTEDRPQRISLSSALRPPSSVLRVLLVDDHKVMREGLATLLNEQSDLEVVGQAGNGREAVDLTHRLRPDVVVMDAAMPVMAGDEATRQIKLRWPDVRVVALSMFEETDMSEAMHRAGAERYLLKTAPSDELLAAIRGRPTATGQGQT
jgi:signal transduction histidine kinase/ActR/RegA family two-component response regulator